MQPRSTFGRPLHFVTTEEEPLNQLNPPLNRMFGHMQLSITTDFRIVRSAHSYSIDIADQPLAVVFGPMNSHPTTLITTAYTASAYPVIE